MEFAHWEPVYEAILDEFGYDRRKDARARDRLEDMLDSTAGSEPLDMTGETVAIAGPAPQLEADVDSLSGVDCYVAASSAAERLDTDGVTVDCMVTDLDKTPETARRLTDRGTPVAVHAHGDNIEALETHVPKMDHNVLIPTTQARPVGDVRNTGGFTDGDRAAFLADQCGADRLVFPGWSFDDETVTDEKETKLQWAGRLLLWLERLRNEQFEVLDGWRDEFDSPAIPGQN